MLVPLWGCLSPVMERRRLLASAALFVRFSHAVLAGSHHQSAAPARRRAQAAPAGGRREPQRLCLVPLPSPLHPSSLSPKCLKGKIMTAWPLIIHERSTLLLSRAFHLSKPAGAANQLNHSHPGQGELLGVAGGRGRDFPWKDGRGMLWLGMDLPEEREREGGWESSATT